MSQLVSTGKKETAVRPEEQSPQNLFPESEKLPALLQELKDKPHRFDFAQAVSLLERYAASRKTRVTRVGQSGPIGNEAVRFVHTTSLAFPIGSIESALPGRQLDSEFMELKTTFFGLLGLRSPLPDFYTRELFFDESEKAAVARNFLNIFYHNLISLAYRAIVKYRYDLEFFVEGRESLSEKVLALMGLLADETSAPLKRYVEIFSRSYRSAQALGKLLSDYFETPCRVEEFIDRWVIRGETDQTFLGQYRTFVGLDFVLGDRTLDCNGTFRICFEVSTLDVYESFLPSGKHFHRLVELVNLFLAEPLTFEIQLVLTEQIQPSGFLGSQLGFTSWLGTPEPNATVVFDAQ